MPGHNTNVFKPGSVGVISRSGSLGTLMCLNLTRAGHGQSAFIGIGGDPIIGTTSLDALMALDRDERTTAVVLVGEIGGSMEEAAAEYARTMRKPVFSFIAGRSSPPDKKMGHAGAIVSGGRGGYASKRAALERAGVRVADTPARDRDLPFRGQHEGTRVRRGMRNEQPMRRRQRGRSQVRLHGGHRSFVARCANVCDSRSAAFFGPV